MWRRLQLSARILVLALLALNAPAQETRGQASVAFQGYYLGESNNTSSATTGAAISFQYYFDKHGQLSGQIEDYVDTARFRTAANYLSWSRIPWHGYRWNLTGGDFRIALQPSDQQIGNLYFPELRLRGVQVEAVSGATTWSVFSGGLEILQGARLPFFVRAPQTITGATAVWKRGETIQIQSSLLHIATAAERLAEQPNLLPEGRTFASSLQGRVHATWRPRNQLRVSSELALHSARALGAQPIPSSPWSTSVSAEWAGPRLTLRGNYLRQGAAYLPLAGYFVGDRKGPFGEIRFKAHRRVDIYATGAFTESNVDRNPAVSTMRASSASAGISMELPLRLQLNAQASTIDFSSLLPGAAHSESSKNRLSSVSLGRSFQRHTVRFGYRDLDFRSSRGPTRQRSAEIEEMVSFRRWTAGAAMRFDASSSDIHRNSLYFRGNLQANLGRISAYAYGETGRDLANQSVFITNQMRSTGAGLSAPLGRQWTLTAELMRTSMNSSLNEQTAFLLAANGAPISMAFPGMNRWNVLVRVSKSFHWGGAGPQSSFPGRSTDQLYPVMGAIEGFVREVDADDATPVASVPVQLDNNRTELTDQDGRFRFTDVAQGAHSVQLTPRQLPAEFDPTSAKELKVAVQARRTTRADLSLVRLGSLSGKIVAPSGTPLDDVIVRIAGSRRYTSPDADGNFTIYNLPQGRYQVTLDAGTLPADHKITTAGSVTVTLKTGEPHDVILFGIARVEVIKPVRRINLPPQPAPIARSNPQAGAEPTPVKAPPAPKPPQPAGRRTTGMSARNAALRINFASQPASLEPGSPHAGAEPSPPKPPPAPKPSQPAGRRTTGMRARKAARRINLSPQPAPIARSNPQAGAELSPVKSPPAPKSSQAAGHKKGGLRARSLGRRINPNTQAAPLAPGKPHAGARLAQNAKTKDPINWRDGHAVADPGRNGQNPGVHPSLPARSLRGPLGVSRQPDLPQVGKPPANRVVQGAGRPQPDPHLDARGKEPRSHSGVSWKPRTSRGLPRSNARNRRPNRNAPGDAAGQGVGNPGLRSGGDSPRPELRRSLPGGSPTLRAKGPDVPAPVRR